MVGGEARDRQRPGPEIAPQFGEQLARRCWIGLVLDRDVQARRAAVLRGEQARETVRDARPDLQQGGAFDAKCDAAIEQVDVRNTCHRRRRVGDDGADQPGEFVEDRWRQMMEQRDMRRHAIAAGRIMGGPQRVEEALVGRARRCGNDDGRGARGPDGRGIARVASHEKGWARREGGWPSSMGRPFSMSGAFGQSFAAIQSISWVTMIACADESEKAPRYKLFQKRCSAAATACGRSAIAQCPASSMTVSGVPVRAA